MELARFAGPDGPEPTFRSVLYFERSEEDGRERVHAGPAAIARYLASEERDGRLMQSLKSFLASRLFHGTQVHGRSWRLEGLIGELLGQLRRAAEADLGVPIRRAVVGRPVHFVHASDAADDALAVSRLEAALHNAGFAEIRFELEPVGAARHYERGLERDELILIGDFGGGTSDFSLLEVGPSWAAGRRPRSESVRGHEGVAVAGDAFDGRIVRHRVAPALGRGAEFESFFGRRLPVPGWIYAHLERWHHISMLKSPKTLQLLLDLRREAVEPARLDALLQVVEQDLGFLLYRATEAAKRTLSERDAARVTLRHERVEIDEPVERAEFEAWIAPELAEIAGGVDRLLEGTGTAPRDVDRVFLTGGSSFVPAVRRLFAERFGAEKLRGGAELTSVAGGLALLATERFAG